jgi:hypothetical protein
MVQMWRKNIQGDSKHASLNVPTFWWGKDGEDGAEDSTSVISRISGV